MINDTFSYVSISGIICMYNHHQKRSKHFLFVTNMEKLRSICFYAKKKKKTLLALILHTDFHHQFGVYSSSWNATLA